VIRREGFLTAARCVPIVRQTAEALSVAHEVGIVHRDIKPANIMLDTAGRAKVTDFGIAQMGTRTRLTRAGFLVGTPEYISPEQCRGEQLDGRSDIYSLGVTFYQMLSGTTPFEADTPAALVLQIIEGNFAPVQEVNPTVPMGVQTILSRMMDPDKNKRFQSAEDVVAAIRDVEAEPSRLVSATAIASRVTAPAEPTEVVGEGASPAQALEPTVVAPATAETAGATAAVKDTPAPPATEAESGLPPTVEESAGVPAGKSPPESVDQAPAAPAVEKAAPAPPAVPARSNRNLFIGIAVALVILIGAIAAWQFLGPGETEEAVDLTAAEEPTNETSQAGASAVSEQGEVAGSETGAEVDRAEATEGTGVQVDDTLDRAAQVEEPAAAGADPGAAEADENQQVEDPALAAQQQPAEPTGPPTTQPEADVAGTEQPPAIFAPPENSVVTTIDGEYEYIEAVIAWSEQVFGREGFLVIDWPSSPARAMSEAARFHIVLSARLQGASQLEYYGRTQTQYTVALTARAIDLGTGAIFAGPRTEMVRYTSVNAEQNLEEAATKLARDLSRELKDKAGLGR
jgi:hypothetical protein